MPSVREELEPRKVPVQARSAASVEAILEASVQILLDVGKERLTTTRVAQRAGVSVGTLYQYFPNKSALLQAVLRRHLNEVTDAVEQACGAQRGKALAEMVAAVIAAFLAAKMKRVKTSAALYAVSDALDGARVSREIATRALKAMTGMLESSPERMTTEAALVASILQGAMTGVSRRMIESGSPEQEVERVQRELTVMACAYVGACSGGQEAVAVRSRVRLAG